MSHPSLSGRWRPGCHCGTCAGAGGCCLPGIGALRNWQSSINWALFLRLFRSLILLLRSSRVSHSLTGLYRIMQESSRCSPVMSSHSASDGGVAHRAQKRHRHRRAQRRETPRATLITVAAARTTPAVEKGVLFSIDNSLSSGQLTMSDNGSHAHSNQVNHRIASDCMVYQAYTN